METGEIQISLPGVTVNDEIPLKVAEKLGGSGEYPELQTELNKQVYNMDEGYQPPTLRKLADNVLEKIEEGSFSPGVRELLNDDVEKRIQIGFFRKYGNQILEDAATDEPEDDFEDILNSGIIPFSRWKEYVSENIQEYGGSDALDRQKIYETAQFEA